MGNTDICAGSTQVFCSVVFLLVCSLIFILYMAIINHISMRWSLPWCSLVHCIVSFIVSYLFYAASSSWLHPKHLRLEIPSPLCCDQPLLNLLWNSCNVTQPTWPFSTIATVAKLRISYATNTMAHDEPKLHILNQCLNQSSDEPLFFSLLFLSPMCS